MPKVIKYINPPKVCDICQGPFVEDIMFDAATYHGPWLIRLVKVLALVSVSSTKRMMPVNG